MEIENAYRTSSLDEAAAIAAAGATFIGLEQKSHRSYYFVFQPADTASCLAGKYQRGVLTVNATSMTDSLTILKDAVFSRLRNGDRDALPYRRDP